MPPPQVSHLLEVAIYVADIEISCRFYQLVFGFDELLRDERMCALAAPGSIVLLFREGGSLQPATMPGGVIPAHGATGRTHVCFAIPIAQLQPWLDHLSACGIEVESRVRQAYDGTSIYFRDPDGHSLEIATPGLWRTY